MTAPLGHLPEIEWRTPTEEGARAFVEHLRRIGWVKGHARPDAEILREHGVTVAPLSRTKVGSPRSRRLWHLIRMVMALELDVGTESLQEIGETKLLELARLRASAMLAAEDRRRGVGRGVDRNKVKREKKIQKLAARWGAIHGLLATQKLAAVAKSALGVTPNTFRSLVREAKSRGLIPAK